MIWYSSDGTLHRQEHGQRCSTCDLYHRLQEARLDQVCCGPAHGWVKTRPCVFCGQDWHAGPRLETPVWTERFTPLASLR